MNYCQNKFEPHILKRGIGYYEKGRGGQVEEIGLRYGSEEYDVRIYYVYIWKRMRSLPWCVLVRTQKTGKTVNT